MISANITTTKMASRTTATWSPIKQVERGIERDTDAASADQAEHGGLADVDVPAKQRDRPERRTNLRPVAQQHVENFDAPAAVSASIEP